MSVRQLSAYFAPQPDNWNCKPVVLSILASRISIGVAQGVELGFAKLILANRPYQFAEDRTRALDRTRMVVYWRPRQAKTGDHERPR